MITLNVACFFSQNVATPLHRVHSITRTVTRNSCAIHIGVSRRHRSRINRLTHSFGRVTRRLRRTSGVHLSVVTGIDRRLHAPISTLRTVIRGVTSKIARPAPTGLRNVLARARHLDSLVTFLLSLDHVRTKTTDLGVRRFGITRFLSRAIRPLRVTSNKRTRSVRVHIDSSVAVRNSRSHLHRLFAGVVTGTLGRSPSGAAILIRARRSGSGNAVIAGIIGFNSRVTPSSHSSVFHHFIGNGAKPNARSKNANLNLSVTQ